MLDVPSEFYDKKSRFYYYKIQEYSDFSEVREDIVWRKLGDIEEHLLAVAWVPLERIIEIAYQGFDFPESKEVLCREKSILQKKAWLNPSNQ